MPQIGPGEGPSTIGAHEPPAAPARRVRRRWRRGVAGVVIAAIALLAAAHLPSARERVRRFAIGTARDRFDTALTIGHLDYNLLTLTFTLRGVSAAAVGAADRPFFRAERLAIGLTPGTLIGRLAFTSIELVRPRLAFTRDAEGRYLLPAGGGGRSGQNPRIRIDRLAVRGLDLQIEGVPPLTIDARGVAGGARPAGRSYPGTADRRQRCAVPLALGNDGRCRHRRDGRPVARHGPHRAARRDAGREPGDAGWAPAVRARAVAARLVAERRGQPGRRCRDLAGDRAGPRRGIRHRHAGRSAVRPRADVRCHRESVGDSRHRRCRRRRRRERWAKVRSR